MYHASVQASLAYLPGVALALAKEIGGRHPDAHHYGKEGFEVIRRGAGSAWRAPTILFEGDFVAAVEAAARLAAKNHGREYVVLSKRSPGFRVVTTVGFNPTTHRYSLEVSRF